MKKSELLEKLKDIQEDAEIDETINGIEGLIKPFDLSKITLEQYKEILENNEVIKGYNTSTLDSVRSKAVETYKNGKGKEAIKKAIEEAKKSWSDEGLTPEQKQVRDLQAQLEAMQKQQKINEVKGTYSKQFAEKGLDIRLLDFLNLDREGELIDKDITTLEEIINNTTSKKVDETFRNNPTPPSGSEGKQQELSGVEKAFYDLNPNLQ